MNLPGKAAILVLLCLASDGAWAKASPYFRATALLDEDPLEADAIFSSLIGSTNDAKIRRAATHQLFYLRLKSGRSAEAYSLVVTKAMHDKYISAISAELKIPEAQADRLVARLKTACGKNYDLQKISVYLEEKRMAVPVYDFSYRVLAKCRPSDAKVILPAAETWDDYDKRTFALGLFAIREAIASGNAANQKERLAELESRGAALVEKNANLRGQLLIIKSRMAIKNSEFDAVREICRQVYADEGLRKFRNQCRYLNAFVLVKEGKGAEAHALLTNQKVQPIQVDNRLLKLIAGVSAGKVPGKKLETFMQRSSYQQCAPMLRELAAEVLK